MNVPKLRFKEFSGEWEEKTFRDIVSLNLVPVEKPNTDYVRLGIRSHCKGTFHELVKIEDLLEADKMFLVPKDNLILNITFAWEHAIAITDENDEGKYVSGRFPTFAFKKNEVPTFYESIIRSKRMKYELGVASPGGAGRNRVLNKELFLDIPVKTTDFEEQTKIAEFVKCIDEKIENQKLIVESLENQKKGLMQKIFSQQLRFKDDDGKEFPKWEEKKLGEVVHSFDYGMNVASCEYDGENKYIRITDIDDLSHKYSHENVVSPNGGLEDKYLVGKNDILFARTGASTGKTYLYDEKDGKLYFAGFLIRGNVKDDYNSYFIFIQTLISRYKKWVSIESIRSGQPGINAEQYKEFMIYVPCLKEQNKIVGLLKLYDDRIEVARNKVEHWQQIKKGLLQQMFV